MNGFLQVRIVGMRQNNKKKLLKKKKDGERNLHFASCPPEVQAALRETRRAKWKKWRKCNAGAILTDEEVRQLTEAGSKMYHMQWIGSGQKRTSAKRSRPCFSSCKVKESIGRWQKFRDNGGTSH